MCKQSEDLCTFIAPFNKNKKNHPNFFSELAQNFIARLPCSFPNYSEIFLGFLGLKCKPCSQPQAYLSYLKLILRFPELSQATSRFPHGFLSYPKLSHIFSKLCWDYPEDFPRLDNVSPIHNPELSWSFLSLSKALLSYPEVNQYSHPKVVWVNVSLIHTHNVSWGFPVLVNVRPIHSPELSWAFPCLCLDYPELSWSFPSYLKVSWPILRLVNASPIHNHELLWAILRLPQVIQGFLNYQCKLYSQPQAFLRFF